MRLAERFIVCKQKVAGTNAEEIARCSCKRKGVKGKALVVFVVVQQLLYTYKRKGKGSGTHQESKLLKNLVLQIATIEQVAQEYL